MTDTGWTGDLDRNSSGRPWLEVVAGVAIVIAEHIAVGGLLAGIAGLASMAPNSNGGAMAVPMVWGFGIGVTQLAYVLPSFLVALLWRRNVAAGIALGSLLTFLLNGACFGVLCASS